MPSLDDAYGGGSRFEGRDPRLIYGGAAVVVAGACALLVALWLVALGGDAVVAKKYAGLFGGLGVPAMLLGVVLVLPANRRQRAGVLAGAALTLLGVVLFWHAYPARWTRTADPLAFPTALLYGLGGALALWFVFAAIASIRLRNTPAGTVTLELVRQGSTRTVELSRDRYESLVSDGGDPRDVIRELDQ
jgi:Na+/proline symporter